MSQSPDWTSSLVPRWREWEGVGNLLPSAEAAHDHEIRKGGVAVGTQNSLEPQFTTFPREVPTRAVGRTKCSKSFPRLPSVDGWTETKS